MKAITFDEPGGPEVLTWSEAKLPVPGPNEVVIDVVAAGLNNADLMQRQGWYPPPPGASPILGLEVSGVISWAGADVSGWKVGDAVCALLTGGGYAQQVVADAGLLLPVLEGVDMIDSAGLPEATCTVYSNLGMLASLSRGQTVLIHGGAGGIGTTAIQWAVSIGATVLTTVGSEAKRQVCLELGATAAINYRDDNFAREVLALTGGRGVDAILDVVGPDYLERNLVSLASGGHLVVIGSAGSRENQPLDLGLLMSKRASVSATTLRARPLAERVEIVRQVRDHVWPQVESGALRPAVDAVIPMSAAAEAHRRLASGQTIGKVLLLTPEE